jgi:hypothetical protein
MSVRLPILLRYWFGYVNAVAFQGPTTIVSAPLLAASLTSGGLHVVTHIPGHHVYYTAFAVGKPLGSESNARLRGRKQWARTRTGRSPLAGAGLLAASGQSWRRWGVGEGR